MKRIWWCWFVGAMLLSGCSEKSQPLAPVIVCEEDDDDDGCECDTLQHQWPEWVKTRR